MHIYARTVTPIPAALTPLMILSKLLNKKAVYCTTIIV